MLKVRALALLGILSCAAVASADTVNSGLVDGVKGSNWSAADIIGSFTVGAGDQVVVYAQQDADYVYVAYQYEGNDADKDFDGVNNYVDSWASPATYGDGDDVIIEGGNYHWSYSLDGPPWATTPTPFTTIAPGEYGDTTNGVYEGYNSGSDFSSFAINKNIVDWSKYSSAPYDTIEIGGQAWTYDFNWIEIDPNYILNVPIAVPLPASAWSGLSLMGLVAATAYGRRRIQSA